MIPSLHRRLYTVIFCLCACILHAEPEICLTGNAEQKAFNKRLLTAGYRYVWVGTNQPVFPGERYLSGWLSFKEGMLCDDHVFALPFQSQLRDKTKYTSYAWPRSKKGVELEIDLGRVCEVTRFSLAGSKEIIVKGYSDKTGRWLPLVAGEGMLKIRGFRCRRFRVENTGDFAEMYIWGRVLDEGAATSLPQPLPAATPDKKFAGLNLKPSGTPPMAPDPFVYPQPQEMSFGKEVIVFPKDCPLVIPPGKNADAVRQIAETLSTHIKTLVNLDFRITDKAAGPAVYLGLASDPGIWSEVGERRRLAEDQIAKEGYAVDVADGRVVLVGRDLRGLYYATRTFLFLIGPRLEGVALPVGFVRDFPRSEIRPAFAFAGWSGVFKRQLATALASIKFSYLQGAGPQRDLMRENFLHYFIAGQMFPGSKSGTEGDLLEKRPGASKKALNPNRLSACPCHPDFFKRMTASWDRSMEGWEGEIIDIGYDEIFHNPFNVCARCRARGLTTREVLLDCYMKAYRYFKKRGFGINSYATGFRRYKPFDMFVDVPPDSVVTNYNRSKENAELAALGYRVIAGSTGTVRIDDGSPLHACINWNWGSEHPAAMWGERKIRSQVAGAEQNWSTAGKTEWGSPEWQARINRAMVFMKHMINVVPLPIPGLKHEYFTIDISSRANRTLRDEAYADGRGWLDEGPGRDLRHFPTGSQKLDGIQYDIPAGEKNAIVVASHQSAEKFLPDQVTGIEVRRKAAELFFLHACSHRVWTSLGRRVMLIGFYRVRYDDGTFVTAEVNYGQHIREWTRDYGYREMEFEPTLQPLPDARVAWRGGTDGGHDVTIYSMPWRNPYPDKTIAAVDVLASAQAESARNRWMLLGISGRVPTEGDIRSTAMLTDRPAPRVFRPRPALPEGVAPLDLVRLTAPPLPGPLAYNTEFETHDKWFKATITSLGVGSPLSFQKSELNRGPYSALDPDDDPWRCASEESSNPCALQIRFKRLIPLHGIGVKGILQRIRYPGLHPVDLEVTAFDAEGEEIPVGKVTGHVGQEGEERWLFDSPMKLSGIEIRVLKGAGISAVYLYAKEDAIKPPRYKLPKMDKKEVAIGDEENEKEEVTDEDVIDEFEGVD
ncbi:MAG: glycoside hydrolase family 20 zincin-like fold domain-containing protein [Planctomycetota bacterium]|nr:glycoside hydrolase family 20 zincin-like fold domain-containing protein [Planctomycetota bacterium]